MENLFFKSLHGVQFCLVFRKKIMENIFKNLKTQFPLKMENTIELKNTTPK